MIHSSLTVLMTVTIMKVANSCFKFNLPVSCCLYIVAWPAMKRPQQEELVDEEEELVDGIRKKLCIRKTPSPEPTPESLECAECGWQLDSRPDKANYGYCAHCHAEPLCWGWHDWPHWQWCLSTCPWCRTTLCRSCLRVCCADQA